MSLKKRFKKALGMFAMGPMAVPRGAAAVGTKMGQAAKKKKLRAGMLKATGQSKASAQKIKQRVDIAAKRKSAGKSYKAVPKSAGFRKEMKKKY